MLDSILFTLYKLSGNASTSHYIVSIKCVILLIWELSRADIPHWYSMFLSHITVLYDILLISHKSFVLLCSPVDRIQYNHDSTQIGVWMKSGRARSD